MVITYTFQYATDRTTNDVQEKCLCVWYGMRTHLDCSGRNQQAEQQNGVGDVLYIAMDTGRKDI